MNPINGDLYDVSDSDRKRIEDKIQSRLVRVPLVDEVKVKDMNTQQRKSYAKKLRKRKLRARAARKANR